MQHTAIFGWLLGGYSSSFSFRLVAGCGASEALMYMSKCKMDRRTHSASTCVLVKRCLRLSWVQPERARWLDCCCSPRFITPSSCSRVLVSYSLARCQLAIPSANPPTEMDTKIKRPSQHLRSIAAALKVYTQLVFNIVSGERREFEEFKNRNFG